MSEWANEATGGIYPEIRAEAEERVLAALMLRYDLDRNPGRSERAGAELAIVLGFDCAKLADAGDPAALVALGLVVGTLSSRISEEEVRERLAELAK